MWGKKINKYEYFYPPEVVCRDSKTQLKVGENCNSLIYLFKRYRMGAPQWMMLYSNAGTIHFFIVLSAQINCHEILELS